MALLVGHARRHWLVRRHRTGESHRCHSPPARAGPRDGVQRDARRPRTASTSRSPGPTRSPAQTTERTTSPSTTAPGSDHRRAAGGQHVGPQVVGRRPAVDRRGLGDRPGRPALRRAGRARTPRTARPGTGARSRTDHQGSSAAPTYLQVAEVAGAPVAHAEQAGPLAVPAGHSSPTGSPAAKHASALVSSTAAPSTQSRSAPERARRAQRHRLLDRDVDVPAGQGGHQLVRVVVGVDRRTADVRAPPGPAPGPAGRGRPPGTAPWAVRRSAAAAGVPAPAASTTPTSPSRVTRPRSHAGNRRPPTATLWTACPP